MKIENDIDVVIPWVDGSDPLHQKKLRGFLTKDQKFDNKSFRTRYDQVEEIEYAIKSILKFAPYVRKIFLVTDNQIPNFLKNADSKEEFKKVVVVDHKEIFIGYEKYLPVFNSNSIETMLFKIPDLSERFIYFNDDVFLIKDTVPEDFFINGYPVVRGVWETYDTEKIHKNLGYKFLNLLNTNLKKNKVGYKKAQQNIVKELGFKRYLKLDHTPCSIRKSVLENYFKANPDKLLSNIKYKFRHHSYFLVQSLVNHLEIQNKTCSLKTNYQLAYIQSYKKPLIWYKLYLKYCSLDSNKLFMCLQSLDQCPPKKLNVFLEWL